MMPKPRPTPEEWRDAYLKAVGSASLDEVATALAEKEARKREKRERKLTSESNQAKDHPHGKA
jgi:hypothetical protein